MRKICVVALLMLFIVGIAFSDTVTVQGDAYLEGSTNHAGIKVLFRRIAPFAFVDSTTTNSSGHYTKQIPKGVYNIVFSKVGYRTDSISSRSIYSSLTLPNITLRYVGLSGNISGIIGPGIYRVGSTIIVPRGETLIVRPGTRFEFANGSGLIVYGTLIAEGLWSNKIFFLSDSASAGWGGISFNEAEDCILYNCIITDVNGMAITMHYTDNLTIDKCEILYNRGGIRISESYNVLVARTKIVHNTGTVIDAGVHTGVIFRRCLIAYNEVPYSAEGNVIVANYSTTIENCIIVRNKSRLGACVFIGNGAKLINSVIAFNDVEIAIKNFVSDTSLDYPAIINSIIAYNTHWGAWGNIRPYYCDFWQNGSGNFFDLPSWIGTNVTVNANGDSCDALYNIQLDPMFVDTSINDFHLLPTSPCIDAGAEYIVLLSGDTIWSPDEDYAGGRRPAHATWDIGVYEYGAAGIEESYVKPSEFELAVYPNPFNSSCVIYAPSNAVVEIYNLNGKLVHRASTTTGKYVWNPHENVSSGVYIVRAFAKGRMLTTRAVLIK